MFLIKSEIEKFASEKHLHYALVVLRKLLRLRLTPELIHMVILKTGLAQMIITLCNGEFSLEIRSEASWVLVILLSSDCEDHIKVLSELGIISSLISLIDEPSPTLNENVWIFHIIRHS